jgi:hypothetical protein
MNIWHDDNDTGLADITYCQTCTAWHHNSYACPRVASYCRTCQVWHHNDYLCPCAIRAGDHFRYLAEVPAGNSWVPSSLILGYSRQVVTFREG